MSFKRKEDLREERDVVKKFREELMVVEDEKERVDLANHYQYLSDFYVDESVPMVDEDDDHFDKYGLAVKIVRGIKEQRLLLLTKVWLELVSFVDDMEFTNRETQIGLEVLLPISQISSKRVFQAIKNTNEDGEIEERSGVFEWVLISVVRKLVRMKNANESFRRLSKNDQKRKWIIKAVVQPHVTAALLDVMGTIGVEVGQKQIQNIINRAVHLPELFEVPPDRQTNAYFNLTLLACAERLNCRKCHFPFRYWRAIVERGAT